MKIAPSLNQLVIGPTKKSLRNFIQQLQTTYQNLSQAFNGNIGYGDGTNPDNISGNWVNVVTPATPNTNFTVNHNLLRLPVGYHVVQKSATTDVFTGTIPSTSTQLTLQATEASVTIRLFIFGILLLLIPALGASQGVAFHDIAFQAVTATGNSGLAGQILQPIAGAVVTVCNGSVAPAAGTTCSGLASIYSCVAVNSSCALSNPTNADNNGNINFFVAAGANYVISISGVTVTTYSYVWTASISSSAGGAFSGGLGTSYQDVGGISTPVAPASGNARLFFNSSTGFLNCLTSLAANCMSGVSLAPTTAQNINATSVNFPLTITSLGSPLDLNNGLFDVEQTFSGTANAGIYNTLDSFQAFTPSGISSNQQFIGINGTAQEFVTVSLNGSSVIGVQGSGQFQGGVSDSTSTVTGGSFKASVNGATNPGNLFGSQSTYSVTSSGTFPKAFSAALLSPTAPSGATITLGGGLYIPAQCGGGATYTTCYDIDEASSTEQNLLGSVNFPTQVAPSNPPSGQIRVYGNSTSGNLSCLTSSGGNCMPSNLTETTSSQSNLTTTSTGSQLVTILTPSATGMYRVAIYAQPTTIAVGCSTFPTVVLQIEWNDGYTGTLIGNTTGSVTVTQVFGTNQESILLYAQSGTPIKAGIDVTVAAAGCSTNALISTVMEALP